MAASHGLPHPHAALQPSQGGRTESRAPEPILAQHWNGPLASPVRHDGPGPGGPDSRQARPATTVGGVQIHRRRRRGSAGAPDWIGVIGSRWRLGERLRRRQGAGRWRREARARPRAPGRARRPPEGTVGLAIRHDFLGERETDPGKPGQLRAPRPGRRRSARRDRAGGRGRGCCRDGRLASAAAASARSWTSPGAWPGRVSHQRTPWPTQPERQQQEQRTALGGGHARHGSGRGSCAADGGTAERAGIGEDGASEGVRRARDSAAPTPSSSSAPAPPPRRPRSAGSPRSPCRSCRPSCATTG